MLMSYAMNEFPEDHVPTVLVKNLRVTKFVI
jgi:hypothetical protein